MATIDVSYIASSISTLNQKYTNIFRKEQIEYINACKQESFVNSKKYSSKKANETDEDVSSTVAELTFSDGQITLSVHTNANNDTSEWEHNGFVIAKTLLHDDIQDILSFHKNDIVEQIKPIIYNALGGIS